MNRIKKLTAVILAFAMVLALASCTTPISLTKEWSFKNSTEELPIGVYIYSLYTAYNQASTYAKDAEGYDAAKSFMDLTIKDEDGKESVAKDWILTQAKKITKSILAIDTELEKMGVTASPDQVELAKENSKIDWEQGGQYASYYAQMGYQMTPYKNILEPYGISFESYHKSTYLAQVMQDTLFRAIYDEGGTKAVSDEDLQKFFLDNYTDYSYFQVDFKKSSTDKDGNATSVAMTDKEKKAVKKNLDKYVSLINKDGKDYKAAVDQYMKDYKDTVTTDPTVSATEIVDKSSSLTNDDLKAAIKKLETGKATVVSSGEGENEVCYVVYKGDIKKSEYIKNNRVSVVAAMKIDEFNSFVDEITEKVEFEENTSAISRYNPTMFEDFSNVTTTSANDSTKDE